MLVVIISISDTENLPWQLLSLSHRTCKLRPLKRAHFREEPTFDETRHTNPGQLFTQCPATAVALTINRNLNDRKVELNPI